MTGRTLDRFPKAYSSVCRDYEHAKANVLGFSRATAVVDPHDAAENSASLCTAPAQTIPFSQQIYDDMNMSSQYITTSFGSILSRTRWPCRYGRQV